MEVKNIWVTGIKYAGTFWTFYLNGFLSILMINLSFSIIRDSLSIPTNLSLYSILMVSLYSFVSSVYLDVFICFLSWWFLSILMCHLSILMFSYVFYLDGFSLFWCVICLSWCFHMFSILMVFLYSEMSSFYLDVFI